MEFKDNLKALRLAASLSQEQLALQCGFNNQSRISNYENGSRQPSMSDLIALARELGTSTDALLGVAPLGTAEPRASYGAGDDLERIRTDILALRQSVLILAAAMIENAPSAAELLQAGLKRLMKRLSLKWKRPLRKQGSMLSWRWESAASIRNW